MDLLPTLNEGDERVSLGDILLQRDGCLSETELWAVCKECCLALQGVHVSSDMFQTLCVTPDSVAFDTCGTVCFLDLAADPEPMYVPPEYESVGNSYKAHLFSLGMTLLFAAEYNVSMAVQRPFSADLGQTINRMTLDDFEERADLGFVISMCSKNLGDRLSDEICSQLANSVRADASFDDASLLTLDNTLTRSPRSLKRASRSPIGEGHSPKLSHRSRSPDSCSPSPSHSSQVSEDAPSDTRSGQSTPRAISPPQSSSPILLAKDAHKSASNHMLTHDKFSVANGGSGLKEDEIDESSKPSLNDISGVVTTPGSEFSSFGEGDSTLGTTPSDPEATPLKFQPKHYLPDLKQYFPDLLDTSDVSQTVPDLLDASDVTIELTSEAETLSHVSSLSTDTDLGGESSTNNSPKHATKNVTLGLSSPMQKPKRKNAPESDRNRNKELSTGNRGGVEVTSNKDNTLVPHQTRIKSPGVHSNTVISKSPTTKPADTDSPRDSPQLAQSNFAYGQKSRIPLKVDRSGRKTNSESPSPKCVQGSDKPNMKTNSVIKTSLNRSTISNDSISKKEENVSAPLTGTSSITHNASPSTPRSSDERGVMNMMKTSQGNKASADIKHANTADKPPRSSANFSHNTTATTSYRIGLKRGEGEGRGLASTQTLEQNSSVVSQSPAQLHRAAKTTSNTHKSNTSRSVLNETPVKRDNLSKESSLLSVRRDILNSAAVTDSSTDAAESCDVVPQLVTFSSIFGDHVHRDTSTDSLALIGAPDDSDSQSQCSDTSQELPASSTHESVTSEKDDVMKAGSMEKRSGSTSLKRRVRDRHKSQQKGQTVVQILERLGSGLHEAEVWALCRECVLAMQRNRLELPAYVSTETVTIEDSGRVTYGSVPDDKHLDVEFLAPELQQHGIVTEKSCLYGLAAMLWSTADFGLAPNHEPILSNELESLLLSMTNESVEQRPTAIDVLQVCNEFQKKQETTSTKICLNLAAEARKAGDFDKKNNRLVQDIIAEDKKAQLESKKTQLLDMIKSDAPQANLKPAAAREIAELKKEPTLHENLMGEIQRPIRKLRKSSRPRLMAIKELYRHNPDLLRDLQRVTGKQTTPTSPPLAHVTSDPTMSASVGINGPIGTNTGAFTRQSSGTHSSSSVTEAERDRMGSAASTASQGSVPDAFKSKATHFTPIVVTDDITDQNAATKEQKPKIRTAKDEENVAQKIKQLKKNLMKNRPPINLAQDLENDVLREQTQNTETSVTKTPDLVSTANKASPRRNSLPVTDNLLSLPQPQQLGAQTMQLPYGSNPGLAAVTGFDPNMLSQLQQQQQAQVLQQSLTGSVPNLAAANAPLSYPSMAQPFPYQIQLQQDPATGLYQLIPVPVPTLLNASSLTMASQNPYMLNQGQLDLMGANAAAQQQNQLHKSQPMSPYSGSSTDGEKPERVRHTRKKPMRDRRAAGKPRPHSGGESRSSEGQQGQYRSSRRRGNEGEGDDFIDTQNSNGASGKSSDLSPVFEHRSLRPGSVETLDNKTDSNGTQPRTPRTVKLRDMRNKLKRAKSGSSVDFRPTHSDNNLRSYEIYDDTYLHNKKLYDHLSRSQPNLDSDLLSLEVSHKSKSPSPPSPDSGVSGMYLMERLLNGDTQRQQRLSKVIKFIRDEFAFDGFMENGIEEQVMAEYIVSLGNLTFSTFSGAITEKYEDLYFEEDLVANLYDAVNGRRPVAERRSTPHNTDTEPDPSRHKGGVSAFRPITDPGSSMRFHQLKSNQGDSLLKPKAVKYQKNKQKQDWRSDKRLEKAKSSSLHDLLSDDLSLRDDGAGRIKSRSQENLLGSNHELSLSSSSRDDTTDDVTMYKRQSKPSARVIAVQSLDSSNDSSSSSKRSNSINTSRSIDSSHKNKSKSTFTINRPDSSTSSTSSDQRFAFGGIANGVYRQHPLMRNDSISSGSSGGGGTGSVRCATGNGMKGAKSESFLATILNDALNPTQIKMPTTAQHYREMSRMGRGCVVYYAAEMESRMRQDVKDYAAQIDPKTKENIENKMAELDQQMMVEHRNKKKTQKYYRKLVDATKASKVSSEHKVKMNTVSAQIDESSNRLDFLDAAKKHLEMLHAEQWGLDVHHLYALARCEADEPMLLGMCDNPLLQYQLVRNPRLGIEGHFLQAGQPEGLMAYLFAQNALSEGYIHHFFYAYRYFSTAEQLLEFISAKHIAACMSLEPEAEVPTKVKARALDLIQVWMEGYFTIDFKHNTQLLDQCIQFLQDKVLPVESSTDLLLELIEECQDNNRKDLHYPEFTVRKHDTNNNANAEQPLKKWESFKAALHLNAKPMKLPKSDVIKPKAGAKAMDEGTCNSASGGRVEAFNVLEHSTQALAEQLTLIEQELFIESHPVHYLNSRHLGISVALLNPTIQRTHTLTRSNSGERAWAGAEADSLFAGHVHTDDVIQRLIEHAQSVAFWVASEIVSCSTQKTQVALLTKFIHVARCLQEQRNYATCVAIVDGLENLIVRQLPAWKNLPSKAAAMKEELSSLKLFLKSDSLCLSGEDGVTPRLPTIPCVLLFLIHVQQLEIGGFKLANQMYRWSKLKSIATMVDQIRVFRQHPYTYTSDVTLQNALRMRIAECASQDLHTLASQHAANVPRISSGSKLSLFKKKKKYKLDS